ncbi:LysM peptidoglycan-binding domain-containing protein [Bacteroidota bacterium]
MRQFYWTITLTLIVLMSYSSYGTSYLIDSIGVEKIEGRWFLIHRVDQNETIYGLAKRYGVSSSDILNRNPEAKKGLSIGEKLEIPLRNYNPDRKSEYINHTVKLSETLYSISRQYGVSVGDLTKWNDLESNEISVGQVLVIRKGSTGVISMVSKEIDQSGRKIVHIVRSGETLFSIANKYDISLNDIRVWNSLDNNNVGIGQELIVGFTDKEGDMPVKANTLAEDNIKDSREGDPIKAQDIPESNFEDEVGEDGFRKITERGVASVISGSESTKKYLALHRSAPVGTIMQVRNEMNDLTVFVRVIGKLPDTGENARFLIKISKTAYERLRAVDDRFMVEITFHP